MVYISSFLLFIFGCTLVAVSAKAGYYEHRLCDPLVIAAFVYGMSAIVVAVLMLQ